MKTDAAWIDRLKTGAATLGHPLAESDAARLAAFADRLIEWGGKMDLSAIDTLDEIREKHFLDSIAGLALLDTPGPLFDLGSGGGFPGLVIAALRPEVRVVSVESRSKKGVFQRQVARDLGLANLEVRTERIEEVVRREAAPAFATARALADLTTLLGWTRPWLEQGCALIAWKSSRADEELRGADSAMESSRLFVDRRVDLLLPESGDPRTLLRIRQRAKG